MTTPADATLPIDFPGELPRPQRPAAAPKVVIEAPKWNGTLQPIEGRPTPSAKASK